MATEGMLPQRDRDGHAVGDVARAISTTTIALGSTVLAITAILVLLCSVDTPPHNAWVATLFLVPIAVMMAVTHRWNTLPVMVAYLVIGSTSLGFFSAVIVAAAPPAIHASPFLFALPQIAVIYTIAPTMLEVRSIIFIALAYLFCQGAVRLAECSVEIYPAFDVLTCLATAMVLTAAISNLVLRHRARADYRAVERARRESDAMAYQQELETQVVALFHDTVLSELTVLARQEPGPLSVPLRTALHRDLARIAEGAWWPAAPNQPRSASSQDVREADETAAMLPRGIADIVAQSAAEGVLVAVLGDLASLHRFTPPVATALELALGQAFVNVRQHSGVDRAELVVDGTADAVVVMLADAGSGFDPATVSGDRLGVSQSILGRLQDVGGQVQLFSSPGNGTAYLFTLPVAPEHAWPGGDDDGRAGA